MIRYGLGVLVAAGACAAAGVVACGDDGGSGDQPITGNGGSAGNTGGATGGGAPNTGGGPASGGCVGPCCPSAAECYSSPAGKTAPGAECLAETDNTGHPKRIQMRQRWINITKPAGLKLAPVYTTLNNGTQLKQPQCNSSATAASGYMQLIDFNLDAGESYVGFAKYIPEANIPTAVSTGFCMAEEADPWFDRPIFQGATVEMPLPAAELYKGADSQPPFPDGLVDPMPQPWTSKRTRAKRLDQDFNLATDRARLLTELKPDGLHGAAGFNAVFYFNEATGESHGYSPMNWQVIYDSTGADFILVPIREPETRSKFTNPAAPNCVGKYNSDLLKADTGCQPGADSTLPDFYGWGGVTNKTAGQGDASTTGYFLTVELEQVWTSVLNMSLCVLYPDPTNSATWGMATTPKRCREDPRWNALDPVAGLPPADWCAATNGPATATCHDAYQVSSFHAFAATKVQDAACPAD